MSNYKRKFQRKRKLEAFNSPCPKCGGKMKKHWSGEYWLADCKTCGYRAWWKK